MPVNEEQSDSLPTYVPDQHTGKASDIVTSDDYESPADAQKAFRQTRAHMLDVNGWNHLAEQAAPARTLGGLNPLFPDFRLLDSNHKSAHVDSVIEIAAGGQKMFVCIEKIIDQPEEFAIRVRPCLHDGSAQASEHMYTPDATTTFRLTLVNQTVTTGFHGRNEVINDDLLSGLVDAGMNLGGRRFTWSLLGRAWRPQPEDVSDVSAPQ